MISQCMPKPKVRQTLTFTPERKAFLKEKLLSNEPELAREYFSIPVDQMHPDIPMLEKRVVLLSLYLRLAEIDPVVDRELLLLLKECEKRMEPIPEELKLWATRYTLGSEAPPKRGRPSEIMRDLNIAIVVGSLRGAGFMMKEAVELLCEILSMEEITVIKACRRGREVRNQVEFRIFYFRE